MLSSPVRASIDRHMAGNNGWDEYRIFVVKTLEEMKSTVKRVEGDINDIKKNIAVNNVRHGILGALGGAVTAIAIWIVHNWLK